MATFYVAVSDNQVPGHSPQDFPANDFDWEQYPASASDYVLTVDNDKIRRTAIAKFISAYHKYRTLSYNGSLVQIATNGDFVADVTREIRFKAVGGAVKMYPYDILTCAFFQTSAWFYTSLKTQPQQTGLYMYADDFVVWSSRTLKRSIQAISDSVEKIKALKPKKFIVADRERYGLVAEENPSVSVTATDDQGKESLGISQSDVLGLLLDAVQKIEARLTVLEGKVK